MSSKSEELQALIKEDHTYTNSNRTPIDINQTKSVLTQLRLSETAQNLILSPDSFSTDPASLDTVILSNELLAQVRNSLSSIVDSIMDGNQSMIMRVAKSWDNMSWLERISLGMALSVPTMIVGIVANVGFLVTLSSLSAGVYATGGYVLQDHVDHSKIINEKMKEGVFGVGDALVLTISALDTIRKRLTTEVEKFQRENEKLTESVCSLSENIDELRINIESSMITAQYLSLNEKELKQQLETFKVDMDKNKEQYDQTINELQRNNSDHQAINEQLAKQVSELKRQRESLSSELEKTKALTSILQLTVDKLSKTALSDAKQREIFTKQLDSIAQSKEENCAKFVDLINRNEEDIQRIKKQYEGELSSLSVIMKQQEELIKRLERVTEITKAVEAKQGVTEVIDTLVPQDPTKREQTLNQVGALTMIGIMGKKPKDVAQSSKQAKQPASPASQC